MASQSSFLEEEAPLLNRIVQMRMEGTVATKVAQETGVSVSKVNNNYDVAVKHAKRLGCTPDVYFTTLTRVALAKGRKDAVFAKINGSGAGGGKSQVGANGNVKRQTTKRK